MAKDYNEAETLQTRQLLEIAFKILKASHSFHTGQFVRWKKGMKNKKFPAYGEPVVVVDFLTAPVFERKSEEESENPSFREPLDLILGMFAKNEEGFLILHYDSRRFEPFPQ